MRSSILAATLLLSVLAAGFAVRRDARADEAFSPQGVFERSEAANIDDRCADARAFAKRAAKGTDDVDPYAAYDAEHAFIDCFYLKRLNPNVDDMRYLVLAAATCAYLAALQADRESSTQLLRESDDLAQALGAQAPDRPWRAVTLRLGSTTNISGMTTSTGGSGPAHYVNDVVRDPFGKAHPGKYADVAQRLREAITKSLAQISAVPGSSAPAAPATAP